jgi:hypothetical protein
VVYHAPVYPVSSPRNRTGFFDSGSFIVLVFMAFMLAQLIMSGALSNGSSILAEESRTITILDSYGMHTAVLSLVFCWFILASRVNITHNDLSTHTVANIEDHSERHTATGPAEEMRSKIDRRGEDSIPSADTANSVETKIDTSIDNALNDCQQDTDVTMVDIVAKPKTTDKQSGDGLEFVARHEEVSERHGACDSTVGAEETIKLERGTATRPITFCEGDQGDFASSGDHATISDPAPNLPRSGENQDGDADAGSSSSKVELVELSKDTYADPESLDNDKPQRRGRGNKGSGSGIFKRRENLAAEIARMTLDPPRYGRFYNKWVQEAANLNGRVIGINQEIAVLEEKGHRHPERLEPISAGQNPVNRSPSGNIQTPNRSLATSMHGPISGSRADPQSRRPFGQVPAARRM